MDTLTNEAYVFSAFLMEWVRASAGPQGSSDMPNHRALPMQRMTPRIPQPGSDRVPRPPKFPSLAWPGFIYRRLMTKHVERWFKERQGVRILTGAFKDRSGYVLAVNENSAGYPSVLTVMLYGGVVGERNYSTQIGVFDVAWLSPGEASRAETDDLAFIEQATRRQAAEQQRLMTRALHVDPGGARIGKFTDLLNVVPGEGEKVREKPVLVPPPGHKARRRLDI
jgi:hypothetical protein